MSDCLPPNMQYFRLLARASIACLTVAYSLLKVFESFGFKSQYLAAYAHHR